ncbi:MAG TPA: hypothetical protein VNK82_08915 [Terriglobales bacterium]|nr:hypothetical protein [Terriglobales bacterium]
MAENQSKMPCPMCHGGGELERAEVIRKLSDPDLGRKIRIYLAEIRTELPHTSQLLETAAAVRDCREPVGRGSGPAMHPLRRSPKE